MKKNIYTIYVLIILLFTGCEDYLNTSSSSKLSPDNVFTSLYYTESAVLGVYDRVCDAAVYGGRLGVNFGTNSDIEHVGADEYTYNANSYRGVSNYYAIPSATILDWSRLYNLVERANLVVEGIRNSELYEKGSTSEQKTMQGLLGEALTLRALAYLELVRNWGDVPFKLEPTDKELGNVFTGKTNRDEIMDFLIEDLIEAANLLPWIGENAGDITYTNTERVTKGFAKALLGRICLTRAGYSIREKEGFPTEQGSNPEYYYKIAQEHLKELVESGKHALKPSFKQIWQDVCSMNKQDGIGGETLFEAALGLVKSGYIGYDIGVRFYTNSKYGLGNNSNVVNTTAYYFYSFSPADSRRDVTVNMVNYSNNAGEIKEVFQGNTLAFTIGKWDQRWMAENSTWLATNLAANSKFGYGVNWIIMRYADALLMYAEVENELNGGPTEAAKNALTQIRGRAFAEAESNIYNEQVTSYVNNLNSYDDFFNAIVNERAWEFGGEGVRKFDLIRWNLLTKKIQEQQSTYIKMQNGEPVTVFDKTYTALPSLIYYKYKSDNENIDRTGINYYEQNIALDEMSSSDRNAAGWTQIKWLSGVSDETKAAYANRISLFSSGLFKDYNNVCDNRHLFPIHMDVINEYRGTVKNSYGY